MQEHIEFLKKEWLIVKNLESLGYIGVALHIGDCIQHAESMLEEEKALLIKTHGNKKVYDSQIDPTIVTGEEWYNKTFKNQKRDEWAR